MQNQRVDEIVRDPEAFFKDSMWRAGVVGLGYVGLPLLITATESGFATIGFDVSSDRIETLTAGKSHIDDISDGDIETALAAGTVFSDDPNSLSEADAIFICVPSPLGRNRQPDLSFIEAATATIERVVRPGHLIVLESTSYPGTTEDFIVPAVHRAGLELDRNVFVAFSPERVSPGDDLKISEIPKVIGGVTRRSGHVAAAAYQRLVDSVHLVTSVRAAEMTKLLENTYRAVNIGLANEMAQLAHELGIDIWEVIDAASTKPFGFKAFYPGPGVGGHCIPLDPQYLAWRAREARFTTRFIDTAEQVNTKMPEYTASRIAELLNKRGLPILGSEILGVGIAYKPDIADDRESASVEVLDQLARRGAVISVLDEIVGSERIRHHGFRPVSATDDLSRFHMAAILTDHSTVDYTKLANKLPIVFDARGVYRRMDLLPENIESL